MQTSQLGATVQFQKCQAEVAFHRKMQRDDGLPAGRSLAHVQTRLCGSDGKWFVVSASKAVQFERLCKQVFERPDIFEREGGTWIAPTNGEEGKQVRSLCRALLESPS